MIKVGIIGGAGFVAGELIRLLINHPHTEISFITSNSQAGKKVSDIHHDLIEETDLVFTKDFHIEIDVLFLCSGHGKSKEFFEGNSIPEKIKIIDLSADYRLDDTYSYGLPEVNKKYYKSKIANPGCFATAIQLALVPLADESFLQEEVHIQALTGATGAGQGFSATTHFAWRANNISVYKPFEHQHLSEISATLTSLQGENIDFNFIPIRGDFTRGIFASIYTKTTLSQEEILKCYQDYYKNETFVSVTDQNINLKQVVNTNKCLISVQKIGDKLLILSAIDNLLKGASGQALQNMNILFGLAENTGLDLKATYF